MTTLDAAAQPRDTARTGLVRQALLAAIGICLTATVGLLVIGIASDNGHVQLHAGTALVLLLLAGELSWRSSTAGSIAAALAIGLAILAIAILIEGAGALGYDAVTQERTGDLANLHDVGLATTGIGMLALISALAVSFGLLLAHRTAMSGRVVAVITIVIAVVGFFGIKVLVVGM